MTAEVNKINSYTFTRNLISPIYSLCKIYTYHLLILYCLFVSSCVNDLNDVNKTTKLAEPDIERGKDIEMFYSEDGLVKIRIQAPTVTHYLTDKPFTEFNDGLKVDFFNDSMRATSKLTANYGVRYEKDLKTIVRNNVIVINENNEQLSTEELVWDEKKHIIYSDKFVKITTADEVLYGEGLEADERMTHYKILKPQGTINVDMADDEANENI